MSHLDGPVGRDARNARTNVTAIQQRLNAIPHDAGGPDYEGTGAQSLVPGVSRATKFRSSQWHSFIWIGSPGGEVTISAGGLHP